MYNFPMLTNIDLDVDLVAQAMQLSGAKTKREVVDRALREMVQRATRPSIASLFGLGGLDPDYDHKVSRGADAWLRVEEARKPYGTTPQEEVSAPPAAKVRPSSRRKP
jgi:Arc/MetJ family transcription regulator